MLVAYRACLSALTSTVPLAALAHNSEAQIVKIGLGGFNAVLTAICCALRL
jgi:hypothetical protein